MEELKKKMRARGSINGKKELLGENLLYHMNSEPNCNSSKVENNEENLENSKVTESEEVQWYGDIVSVPPWAGNRQQDDPRHRGP